MPSAPLLKRRRATFTPLLALTLGLVGFAGVCPASADEAGRWSTQKPELAASHTRGTARTPATVSKVQEALAKGPAPVWIWGERPDVRYFLKTTFEGGSSAALLKASCDNSMTIFLNGRKVAEGNNWSEPVTADVQDRVRAGKNELVVAVANEGDTAGFALKLALVLPDGSTRYVVSDASWTAALRRDAKDGVAVKTLGAMGSGPWGDVFAKETLGEAANRYVFEVAPGFRVERLYTVPRDVQGSWVSITFDNKGRLIASDESNKGLYRITPPPIGGDQPTKVEKLDAKITSAQGMLYAFDSLYLSINGGPGSGLYRAKDTNGDDQYDKIEKLAEFRGGGEHGPHALRLSPDGKSILVVCGNHTLPPEKLDPGPVMTNWQEDLLLPRQWDANGHARGILAPGGYVVKTDPEGKTWQVVSIGYRNSYDMDFNADGELFVYDSDMEWDLGMPWYRPTRVNHATSGSEFGWRSGTGVWPASYLDSLPPMTDIGPGSPVGVSFGYRTKFPAKYQKALYLCDWTFGTMYALHLVPDGATYRAVKEEFLSRTPLPLTDVAVGPDGALYFSVGGRGTQSELYRVTYAGEESTATVDAKDPRFADLRALRHRLEENHHREADPTEAVELAQSYLGHEDRFIRYAARVALEHQDPKAWQDRVLELKDPEALLTGVVALAHQADKSLQPRILEAIERLDFGTLGEPLQLDMLRALSLVFIRMGEPDAATASRFVAKLDRYFPAKGELLNRELANMLVYVKSPTIAAKAIALMKQGPKRSASAVSELLARNPGYGGTIAQMLANQPDAQNIHYAFALRNLKESWTPEERKFYFRWLHDAHKWSGGASYQGFITNIDKEAFENASESERLVVEASGARAPFQVKELPKPKGPGHEWNLDELLTLSKTKMTGRNFKDGQTMFAAARCVLCHRFGGDGGATGPDLTQAAGRFGFKDLAEAILDPSKVVSDQYRASTIATTSGKVYNGRIVSESKDTLSILTDPEDSTKVAEVAKSDVDEMTPSKSSLMPEKLLNALNEDEVLDLLAYILSRGDEKDPMFRKK